MKNVIQFPGKKRTEAAGKSDQAQKLVSIARSAKFRRRMISSIVPLKPRLGEWPFLVA